jgi:hypothetical protein
METLPPNYCNGGGTQSPEFSGGSPKIDAIGCSNQTSRPKQIDPRTIITVSRYLAWLSEFICTARISSWGHDIVQLMKGKLRSVSGL